MIRGRRLEMPVAKRSPFRPPLEKFLCVLLSLSKYTSVLRPSSNTSGTCAGYGNDSNAWNAVDHSRWAVHLLLVSTPARYFGRLREMGFPHCQLKKGENKKVTFCSGARCAIYGTVNFARIAGGTQHRGGRPNGGCTATHTPSKESRGQRMRSQVKRHASRAESFFLFATRGEDVNFPTLPEVSKPLCWRTAGNTS